MTGKEIIKKIYSIEIYEGEKSDKSEINLEFYGGYLDKKIEQQIGKFKEIEFVDSDSDQDYSERSLPIKRTIYFPKFDVYLKIVGTYSSYGGGEMKDIKEVKKKEKTITVYE